MTTAANILSNLSATLNKDTPYCTIGEAVRALLSETAIDSVEDAVVMIQACAITFDSGEWMYATPYERMCAQVCNVVKKGQELPCLQVRF